MPGSYAALETHKALTAGLDVLLFSDNVPLEEEIELKERARDLGRLVMGPGAGTAMIAGAGLGFANGVSAGPVGIVAAAGTGAQEVMSLLDRWGIGVSHVIGSAAVTCPPRSSGLMAKSAIARARRRPGHRGDPAGVEAAGRARWPSGCWLPPKAARRRADGPARTPVHPRSTRPGSHARARCAETCSTCSADRPRPGAGAGGARGRPTSGWRPARRMVAGCSPVGRSATRHW